MTKFKCNLTLEDATDIQFTNLAGTNTGKIESDGNNLVLSNAVGDILLGDGASDIYIGNGTDVVDILFEVSGSLSAEGNATLTLGGAGGDLALGSALALGGNNLTGGGTITGTTLTGTSLDMNGDADISGSLNLGSYTVASQGNQSLSGKITSFANSGSTNLYLGIKNAAYPNRGWAFNPITSGVNCNLIIKEHGSDADRIKISTGGNFEVLTGSVTATGLDINGAATIDGTTTITSSSTAALKIVGGTGVDTTGSFVLRQNGDDAGNGMAITSSNATSHRLWKDASGNFNIGSSSNSNAFKQDTTGNVTIEGTIGSGAITSTGQITGTELEGTSLDINGNADISGITLLGTTNLTSQRLQVNGYIDITGVSNTALRWYNGSTFRGGLGLDDWAHDGSSSDITMYVSGDNSFHVSTNNVKRLEIDSSGATIAGNADISGDLTVDGTTYGIYHSLVEDGYYHDNYNGSKNLSIFYKNARADLIRYQAVDNYEYWNGSAWVADASQEANVEKLLDGRQDTYWSIPARDYKFRFTTNTTSGWPTQAMIWMQTSWSGSTYPGATMLVEETADVTADPVVWVTKVTAEFTSGNGSTDWGLHARADQALHTGNGDAANETRITIDFYGWSPSNASHVVIQMQNLMITSNYAGAENTDYTNLLSHDKHLRLGDNRKFIAGTSDDLQIYHDGSNSYIKDGGTGDLRIWADSPNIGTASGNKIFYGNSGAAELYFTGGNKKLETVTGGVEITGELQADSLDIDGNADISGNLTGVDTLTATTFSGDLNGTINTATTAATQSAGNNSTKVATTAYADAAVAALVDSAPANLNTLNELAEALNDDDDAIVTINTALGTKLPLAGGTLTGDLTIDKATPRLDFMSNQSGTNVGGRVELSENGNLWVNAQGGKDLWLNWYSPNAQSSNADLAVGDGDSGSAILFVDGSARKVGINDTTPSEALDVGGNIAVSGTVDGIDIATRDAILTSTTTTAGAALPKAGGAMTGAITTNSTFDGVDIATRDAVLTSTTTTANAALPKAGGTMSGAIAMGSQNITGAGTITGTTLTGTSLDINGSADISGTLTIPGTWATTILDGDNVVVQKPNYSNGGWARALMNFKEHDGTSLYAVGAFGTNNTFSYGYIGTAYNDTTMRWAADKTVTFGGNVTGVSTLTATTLSVTNYGLASGDIPNNAANTTGTAAGLSATLAIASGGTAATNSNGWLNSRITTSADGSLNYDATSAVAVNHDSLAGFVPAEHVDWAASGAGTIHASNYIENVVGNLGVTTSDTSLTVTTTNGTNIALPAATTSAWGVMTDEMFDAIAANTVKGDLVVDADEGTKGIIEIASVEEATAGNDEAKAVTAAGLAAHVESRKVHELAAPTAALAMNSQKVTGVADPTAAQDAATKAYTDAKTWNWNDITAGTAPTFNQNTTGSARTLSVARAINGVDFDGSAAITIPTKAYFEFKGYGTSDGTNYEMGELMTVSTAPFNHDTSTGSDGLTAQTIQTIMRSGGTVMPHAGTLTAFSGWNTSAGSGAVHVGLFKVTPTDDQAGNLTPVLLINKQTTASGNAIANSFSETSFSVAFAAGDIIYSAVKGATASKTWYFTSTLEVQWS